MTRRVHLSMAHLALLAMLLLALLPTVGRVTAAMGQTGPGAGPVGTVVALCTMNGLTERVLDIALEAATHPDPAVPADEGGVPHPPDGCQYCPLLAGLTLLACALLAGAPYPRQRTPLPTAPCRAWQAPFIPGLGSRGPPATLPTIHNAC